MYEWEAGSLPVSHWISSAAGTGSALLSTENWSKIGLNDDSKFFPKPSAAAYLVLGCALLAEVHLQICIKQFLPYELLAQGGMKNHV